MKRRRLGLELFAAVVPVIPKALPEQRAAAGRNIGKRSRIILLSTTAKDRLRIGSQPPKMYLA
jgi:hypothetical protein